MNETIKAIAGSWVRIAIIAAVNVSIAWITRHPEIFGSLQVDAESFIKANDVLISTTANLIAGAAIGAWSTKNHLEREKVVDLCNG